MKAIILVAGTGTRLRPYTDTLPKCMVDIKGRPMIEYQFEALKANGIEEIILVGGYKGDSLNKYGKKLYINENFAKTNMLYSLFTAEEDFTDDIIVIYGDIVYKKDILRKLISIKSDLAVVVDDNWLELWSMRFENPLVDAETLKIKNGFIVEIGKKTKNISDINGQYIGMFKISKQFVNKFRQHYHFLKENAEDQSKFNNMYMTDFLQSLADNFNVLTPVHIDGGWFEVDSVSDLNFYRNHSYLGILD